MTHKKAEELDPTEMRNSLLYLSGALRALAPRVQDNDEAAGTELDALSALALTAAGCAIEEAE